MNPKTKRKIFKIIPFGLIWLVANLYNVATEIMATGGTNTNPDTQVTMSLGIFLFSNIASLLVGLFVGYLEVVWLGRLFIDKRFGKKILYKFLIYTAVFTSVIVLLYPIASTIENNSSLSDPENWYRLIPFLGSIDFLSTITWIAFSLMLCLIYSGISENIGYKVFRNLITGKYHQPLVENRIFLFLDMKSSTTIAEDLGHKKYFQFLQTYYHDLSDSIIEFEGEVYQYIGDEIVISWEVSQGLKNNNCINCFNSMKAALAVRTDFYREKFGVSPSFKGGMHLGEVTTGEIGALKKEIFYTGDVLNTTSRIQNLCNDYGTDLLISGTLFKKLTDPHTTEFQKQGEVELKGKDEKVEIFAKV